MFEYGDSIEIKTVDGSRGPVLSKRKHFPPGLQILGTKSQIVGRFHIYTTV